jgi:hypothetical protein
MQAILRSRIRRGKHDIRAPTRIEVSFTLLGVTEADFTRDGKYDAEEARQYALVKFAEQFGADFAAMALSRQAIWTMDVI